MSREWFNLRTPARLTFIGRPRLGSNFKSGLHGDCTDSPLDVLQGRQRVTNVCVLAWFSGDNAGLWKQSYRVRDRFQP